MDSGGWDGQVEGITLYDENILNITYSEGEDPDRTNKGTHLRRVFFGKMKQITAYRHYDPLFSHFVTALSWLWTRRLAKTIYNCLDPVKQEASHRRDGLLLFHQENILQFN